MRARFRLSILVCGLLLAGCGARTDTTWNKITSSELEPASCQPTEQQPTVLYTAKEIRTLDPQHPKADWVLVQCGKIAGLGGGTPPKGLLKLAGGVNERFAQDVIMPGFVDPHLHPMIAAVLLPTHFITPENWNLPSGFEAGVKSPEAYWTKLKFELQATPEETPFISWGWHELWHGPVTRDLLDELDNTRPVIIWQRSFHEIVANTKGLEYLGMTSRAEFDALLDHPGVDPTHANFEDGYFSETAIAVAFSRLAPAVMTPQHLSSGLTEMNRLLLQAGVTTISDMATGIFGSFAMEAGLIDHTYSSSDIPLRTMLMPHASELIGRAGSLQGAPALAIEAASQFNSDKVFLNNRVKLLADGAFFAGAMQLQEPAYLDGRDGKWLTEPQDLKEQARVFWDAGLSLHIHVNGDAGLDAVFAAVEQLPRDGTHTEQQIVLEHLGVSREDQIARIAELKLLVSAQPNYLYVLSGKYGGSLLNETQASEISRLGSLERANVPLALHSDLTMAPAQPLFLAWIAINRINMDGQLMAPEQRISVDKALRAITIDAAKMIGLDGQIGSIEIGKKADFTVLAENPYDVTPMRLKDIEVKGVVFEGRWVPAQ